MGFKVKVNGEQVWESEGDANLVSRVSLNSSQGEGGAVTIPNDMSEINVIVDVRDDVESTYMDLQSAAAVRERAEKVEEASKDKVAEGRKLQQEMDAQAALEAQQAAEAARGSVEEEDARVSSDETEQPATPTKTAKGDKVSV